MNAVRKKYSGRVTVRTASTLHKRLIDVARKEGVSLNLLINNILVEGLGKKRKTKKKKE